jgi:hypothetical protein
MEVFFLQVKVISAAGKIPDPDKELVQRIEKLPEDSDIKMVFREIKEYRKEKAKMGHYPSKELDEDLYRLTI